VREAIAVVVEELGRMGRILEDMSTLARSEDPGFVRPERVEVARFLGDVARSAEPLLGERLVVDEPPAGAVMNCDPQRLAQAVLNLLQNAALHGGEGAPVHLGAEPDGAGWRITVSDQGGGVPVADEERIFQPFMRGGSRAPGSGLGLAIVRGIADAHGGRAGLDNRPGQGATFWVTVPS
jgi:signal transduction histidine kinase